MSLQMPAEDLVEGERGGFFIGADSSEEEENHHELILQKANALASENCLKQAIDWFSVAMRYGPVRPEQLSTFVDCILRNFKSKEPESPEPESESQSRDSSDDEDVFECPSCSSFLGEAVTAACGHSYCRRCLQRRLLSRCKQCGETLSGTERSSVVLCGLLNKWFPEEVTRAKAIHEVDELCRNKCYHEAVSLATEVIQRGECC